ncbi:RING-H2 finger protein ATL3-like [Aristolochia californica]|uniref:RING-H2 finger protein ATL3-like n=1 Tax=Aristolochia californica TaxID=171875 RepID=UPI0035E0F6E4
MSSVNTDNSLKDSVPISVTGTVMLAAIIVLFVAVVFVIFLHFYAKWFWRRNGNSQSRRSGFAFAPSRDGLPSRPGLDASIIRSLPVVVYQSAEFNEGLECAVCLCELSDGEKARLLPKCNHGFHLDCIDMWFQSHSTCPICRNPVASESSDSAPGDSELPVSEMSSADGQSAESVNFPTNVLFWGTQDQVNTGRISAEEGTSSSSMNEEEGNIKIVIEIPRRLTEGSAAAASSPSSHRVTEEETKSPVTRLRSLKRLLSREKRLIVPCSSAGGDIEQGLSGSTQSPAMRMDS